MKLSLQPHRLSRSAVLRGTFAKSLGANIGLLLLTSGLAPFSLPAFAQSSSASDPIYEQPPLPPGEGSAGGRGEGGASRDGGDEDACLSQYGGLRALVPEPNPREVWGLTTLAQPQFFFRIPDLPNDNRATVEFVLENTEIRGVESEVYRRRFTVPSEAGIVRVALPETEDYALDRGVNYRWVFTVLCAADAPEDSFFVSGRIWRVSAQEYSDRQLWFDRLAQFADPVGEPWRDLLDTVGLGELASEPMLPCCGAGDAIDPSAIE